MSYDLEFEKTPLTDLFTEAFEVKYLPSLRFIEGADRWLNKRLKKLRKDRAFMQMNHWTKALFEEDFRRGFFPPVQIRDVNPLVGLGVFTQTSLPKLTYVGEYSGVVRRRKRGEDKTNDYVFRYIDTRFRAPFLIDASHEGNHCRFLNHSDNPNLLSRSLILDDEYHVIFFTKRAIAEGEQLTYDYGPLYWRKRARPLSL